MSNCSKFRKKKKSCKIKNHGRKMKSNVCKKKIQVLEINIAYLKKAYD